MANGIKIFENPSFGEIRTIINEDGKLFFVARDVAKALGYAVPQKAVINHCKHCSKMEHPKNKGTFINIIPESDVYRLTMKLITTITHGIHPMPCDALLNIAMERINAIMDNIRDGPVCPESGEINLYYIIIKQLKK